MSEASGNLWVRFIGNPKPTEYSGNGRIRKDGNTAPNQTQSSSQKQVSDLSWRRRHFQLKNTKMSPMFGNKD